MRAGCDVGAILGGRKQISAVGITGRSVGSTRLMSGLLLQLLAAVVSVLVLVGAGAVTPALGEFQEPVSARTIRATSGAKSVASRNKQQVQTIYFGGFFPWLSDQQPQQQQQQLQLAAGSQQQQQQIGRLILPAVRMALDHINRNDSVLTAYKLEIVPRDTQCNATVSLKEFFDIIYEEPKKMLLYGDACRVSTDPIAKASYFFDLIQVSYADTDPIYTVENYPNFFRVVPSENELSLARIPFIRHFNWTRVGTIYQNLPRYSLPHSKLLTDLERYNIATKQSVSLPGSVDGLHNRDLGDELRKLKEKDVRIILGNFDEAWALRLFCLAYREGMFGRKYQWILTGVSEDKLWAHYLRVGSACSEQELLLAMDGYIITDITPVTRSQRRTISGMMPHEYSVEYKRRARAMNITVVENKFYGYAYDGVWAIADSLHRVDSQLKYYQRMAAAGRAKLNKDIAGLNSLLDFDYHKPIWAKLIRNALNRTKFNGVTGMVSFYKNGRPGLISFSQFQAFRDLSEVVIGSYDALNDQLDLGVGFPIYWRGSSPPIDYTIQQVTPFRISRTIFVIISILALLGIILAFVFLTINIKFRNQRYIKMSSPYLNNLIIIGCILTYTSVIILGLDSGLTSESNFPVICRARAWVLMAGFTLAFGSMFSKTFRVHSIFTNIKLHKKVIKDYKLFMVVLILLAFDICILVVWHYVDPFYRETNNGTSIQDPDNEDILIIPELEHCQSKRMTIFLGIIYVYKGLLMAFGCFLAWETRRVSIPALNDSKYIGLSVYNVVIMCVIGASLSFVLRDQQDASFMIISIFIIFCSTTTLCLVFVPKVRMLIELKQNPRADQRVRATLKTFKKNYNKDELTSCGGGGTSANPAACATRGSSGQSASHAHNSKHSIGGATGVGSCGCGKPSGSTAPAKDTIQTLVEENAKKRSTLKEKVYEIEALKVRLRKVQIMAQQQQQKLEQQQQPKPAGGAGQGLGPASASRLLSRRVSQRAATTTASSLSSSSACQLNGRTANNNTGTQINDGASSSMTTGTTLTATDTSSGVAVTTPTTARGATTAQSVATGRARSCKHADEGGAKHFSSLRLGNATNRGKRRQQDDAVSLTQLEADTTVSQCRRSLSLIEYLGLGDLARHQRHFKSTSVVSATATNNEVQASAEKLLSRDGGGPRDPLSARSSASDLSACSTCCSLALMSGNVASTASTTTTATTTPTLSTTATSATSSMSNVDGAESYFSGSLTAGSSHSLLSQDDSCAAHCPLHSARAHNNIQPHQQQKRRTKRTTRAATASSSSPSVVLSEAAHELESSVSLEKHVQETTAAATPEDQQNQEQPKSLVIRCDFEENL